MQLLLNEVVYHIFLLQLLTYLALFGPQVVHGSATNLLYASRSLARASTSNEWSAFAVISLWIVLCYVYFGQPTLLLPVGFQRRPCFGILQFDIPRMCPCHLQRFIFRFSITLFCPDLCLSSSSLTISYHLIFMIVLIH